MANKVCAPSILAIIKGDFDLDTIDLRYFGVSNSYTFNSAHDFLNDITNIITDVVAATGEVTASVTGGGNLDCNDLTLTNVNGAIAGIWAYDHNGGADSARKLLTWTDTATGLPTGTLSGGSAPLTINAGGVVAFTTT